MDRWDRSVAEDHHRRRNRRENPSFSSTLLDAIYRSIDEGNGTAGEGELILYRETMRKKQSAGGGHGAQEDDNEMLDFRRACMIEKWMEKKVTQKVVVRRNSSVADELDRKSRHHRDFMLLNSSSSSSDSSCGCGFSSSESESFQGTKSRSSSSNSCYTMQRPKPIRTSVCENPQLHGYGGFERNHSVPKQKPKHENGFVKTKSKALKIYGDLKKVKQPISPGGRLASFLNSLFTAGNTKKPKINHDDLVGNSQRKSKSANGSTCSSASSFSRSCLSKTPSSRGKFSNSSIGGTPTTTTTTTTTKRSVRFCPVSVIVDEDCRPCGHKNLMHENEEPGGLMVTSLAAMRSNTTLTKQQQKLDYYVMDEDRRRVQEVARDLLKSYQKKNENVVVEEFDMMRDVDDQNDNVEESDNENDDEDDALSCSSSDLFELDNLSAIGIERYSEELPVYETTHFHTNRAIANGLIL